MAYRIAKPSAQLSGFIKHYWALNNCLPNGVEHVQRLIPNGLPELIFYLEGEPKFFGDHNRITTCLSGQKGGYSDIAYSGKLSLFSVLFSPQGLSAFFDFPIQELYDQHLSLDMLVGQRAKDLESRLHAAGGFEERVAVVESFLLSLLGKRKGFPHSDRMLAVVDLINQTRGVANIDDLANFACLGRRQFERIFSSSVGASPKRFMKIVRFQHAIDQGSRLVTKNLTDLTYMCGYYDQAHMINDFHQFSGMSPKRFFGDGSTYSDYFW